MLIIQGKDYVEIKENDSRVLIKWGDLDRILAALEHSKKDAIENDWIKGEKQ
jgi:hypothetical protein